MHLQQHVMNKHSKNNKMYMKFFSKLTLIFTMTQTSTDCANEISHSQIYISKETNLNTFHLLTCMQNLH